MLHDFRSRITITKLKKAESALSQAFMLIAEENGGSLAGLFTDGTGIGDLGNIMPLLSTKLVFIKACRDNWGDICMSGHANLWNLLYTRDLTSALGTSSEGVMADGTYIRVILSDTNCAAVNYKINGVGVACGMIYVFTTTKNVADSSNNLVLGRDFFAFHFIKDGRVIVYGGPSSNENISNGWCDVTQDRMFQGIACTYKVFMTDTINY